MANKTTAAIAMLLILTFAISLVALPTANAHSPPWEIPNFCYVMPGPRLVGIGQQMTFVMWSQLPVGSSVTNTIRWYDLELEFTKPNGDKQTIGPFTTDPTGSTYTTYTPDQVGNWTVKLIVPEQILTTTGTFANDVWLEATDTATFVVQEEPVSELTFEYPLPTEFWIHPIEGQNDQWYRVSSNWLREAQVTGVGGSSDRAYQPDGAGPNSAHIMWTAPLDFAGGVVGGSNTGVDGNQYYDGSFYNLRFRYCIIMNGKMFYELPLLNSGGGGGTMCRDLVTGEVIWYRDDIPSARFGYLYALEHYNQHGVIPPGLLFTNNFGTAMDPTNGNILFEMDNVPGGTYAYGPSGEWLKYNLDNVGNSTHQNWRLTQWNSSNVFETPPSNGATLDAGTPNRYDWNVSVSITLTNNPTERRALLNDVLLCSNGSMPSRGGDPNSRPDEVTFFALSLKPESIGQLLWMKNIPNAQAPLSYYFPPRQMVDGVFVLNIKETQQWVAFSMYTGEKLWGPTEPETDYNPYAYFSGTVAVTQVCTSAYGKLFSAGYSGMVFCYDLYNGSLLWKYEAPTNRSTWQFYPLHPLAIGDEKLYMGTNEHSSSKPLFKGNKIRCLDVNTGEELWTLTGWGSLHSGALADGCLVYYNCYDNQIYTIGKGPSATTVTAPGNSISLGSSLTIKGMVTDVSAGTKQAEQAARFPNGVPAMSDAIMDDWMSYVYMQKPRPTDAVGVNVTLSVYDSNGNFREIGAVTSDSDGFFSYQWIPDIPGEYKVIASFAGSESYWPSHAVTAFAVDPAPEATPEPTPMPVSMADQYILPATTGIIIAIAVATIVIVLMLRKRP